MGKPHHHWASEKEVEELREDHDHLLAVWTEEEYIARWGREALDTLADVAPPWAQDPDYGGAFDGFTVTSDADPGL